MAKKAKISSTFRLSEVARSQLKEIAEGLEESEGRVLELLIDAYHYNRVTKDNGECLGMYWDCETCRRGEYADRFKGR